MKRGRDRRKTSSRTSALPYFAKISFPVPTPTLPIPGDSVVLFYNQLGQKMTVYRNSVSQSGANNGYALGTLIYANTSGDFELDIRADIETDMTPFNDFAAPICSAVWSPILVNTGSIVGIQGFEGSPPKFKLGVVAIASVDDVISSQFWNYLRQGFGIHAALVSPSGYAGSPTSTADIPTFANVRNIDGALTSNSSFYAGFIKSVYRQSDYLFGATKIFVAPNLATQTYTVAINYLAAWIIEPAFPITNYIFNG